VPLISKLPGALEDAALLLKRRGHAEVRKNLWRSTYRDAYQFAMPARETFTWHTEGQQKNRLLYDSTLQEATYTAANTLTALLFPPWMQWAELAPGGGITKKYLDEHPEVCEGLQQATETFFSFLNASNFGTVISEAALDLQVGTCALSFDEGPLDDPFIFEAIPLSAIEIEAGPKGSIETTWQLREPHARNLVRMYDGMQLLDLPESTQKTIKEDPEKKLRIVQGEIYDPETKKYYGVAIDFTGPTIIWRYDFGDSNPTIVARASKVAGETYGRGRVLLALSDARTLDRMQEFVLTQAALQVAPPMTGVSDGVLNPYTASLTPNTIIPVASNADNSPSLRPLEIGANFNITEQMMKDLRERVRRTLLGPKPSEGPVKSATEISVADRNRLWAMNGEYNRIMAELLAKIINRGVFILSKKGFMPKLKINGRQVAVKYTSPFAKTQNADDIMALQSTFQTLAPLGPDALHMGLVTEEIPAWVARKNGLPESLIQTKEGRAALVKAAVKANQAAQQNQVQQNAAMNAPPPNATNDLPPPSPP
jgi:Bacteriophage head to tail connecting protein